LTNNAYRVKLGQAGRQRAKEEFSKEIMVERIKKLYYKLCE
jgi:glycosyltransferase involved in cell wall biosynthesis